MKSRFHHASACCLLVNRNLAFSLNSVNSSWVAYHQPFLAFRFVGSTKHAITIEVKKHYNFKLLTILIQTHYHVQTQFLEKFRKPFSQNS